MSKVQVPYFSESAIHLAHLCALETWQGYNYATGKKVEEPLVLSNRETKTSPIKLLTLSDEYFLDRLSTLLFSKVKPREFKNQHPINDSFLDCFRKVAGIKQTERRGPKPNYVSGTQFLVKDVADSYRRYNKHVDTQSKIDEVISCVQSLSVAFTDQKVLNQQTSQHVMLATRLLYFVMPNCLVFNYSPEIAKGLRLKGDAEKDIVEYQHKLWEGLNLNWNLLCKYDMPLPKNLDPYIYDVAKSAGWWQRRIFDLALKNNYTKGNSIKVSERVKTALYTKPNIIV
jgi:hypothetical protein